MIPLRALNWLADRLDVCLIRDWVTGDGYLQRSRIWGRLPGEPDTLESSAYLHRFLRGDGDRHLHNHPMLWSFSIVVRGGYTEEKRNRRTGKVRTRRVWPGMINILGPRDFHRIVRLHGKETWTIFVTGPKKWRWYFLVAGIAVAAETYKAWKLGVDPVVSNDPEPPWMEHCLGCGASYPPPRPTSGRCPLCHRSFA